MAIGFLRAKNIHASPQNAAGYRLGMQVEGGRDYSAKFKEVVASGIVLPDWAPREMSDISILCQSWNCAEQKYNRNTRSDNKPRTAKELIIALPIELQADQQERLVRDYVGPVADAGYAVIWSIHDKKDGNPHCHIMISPRQIIKGGRKNVAKSANKPGQGTTNPHPNRQSDTIQGRRGDGPNLGMCNLPILALDCSSPSSDLLLHDNRRISVDKRRQREVKPADMRRMVADRLIDVWAAAKTKKVYKLDDNGNRIPIIDPATGQQKIGPKGRKMWQRETVEDGPDLDKPAWVKIQKSRWQELCNAALLEAGRPERISMTPQKDHKAQHHLGQAAAQMERRGEKTEIGDYNRAVVDYNQSLDALAAKQAESAAKPPTTAQTPPSRPSAPGPSSKSPTLIHVLGDGMNRFLAIDQPGKKPILAGIIETDGGKPRLGPVLDTSQTAAVLATANIEYQKAMSALSYASLGKLAPSPSGGTGAVQRDLMAEMSEESRLEIEEILQMRVNTARMQAEIAADQHRQAIAAAAQLQGRGMM